MWAAFSKLLKDAAERHNTTMITPDFSGWFFVISSHAEELKRQQLGQLPHLVWFTQEPVLQAAMKPAGLGSNAAGVTLPAGPAVAAAKRAAAAGAAGMGDGSSSDAAVQGDKKAAAGVTESGESSSSDAAGLKQGASKGRAAGSRSSKAKRGSASSTASSSSDSSDGVQQYQVPGKPFDGVMLQLGGSSKSSSSSKAIKPQAEASKAAAAASAAAGAAGSSTAGSKELQLHVAAVQMLEDLLAGARYSHAAYGYVAAAGHMSSIGNALKLLATLPLFDPITGG
jgi:hypothetical protein